MVTTLAPQEPQSLLDCWQIVAPFVPHHQKRVMAEVMRAPGYVDEPVFDEPIMRLARTIIAMPRTGQTDGQGDQAVAHLHYFAPSADWWITELDVGSPDDGPGFHQHQAFGLADMGMGFPELGYISINELTSTVPSTPLAQIELDLHWTPVPLHVAKSKRG